jgi:peptide/nickel transport system permease protein
MGARSRGIQENVILYKNVLRNSMITVVTLIGLSIGSLLGGAAVVETIFVWRGLGKMVVDAIGARDYPVIQGFVVWMAIIYVVVNLLTDLSYHLLDPRVKEGWET